MMTKTHTTRGRLARRLAAAAVILVLASSSLPGAAAATRQDDLERLKSELERQYADIEAQFAKLRAPRGTPAEWRSPTVTPAVGTMPIPPGDSPPHYEPPPPSLGSGESLGAWQSGLRMRFARAAATVEAILNLNPPDAETWGETLETLRLYAHPNGSPDTRTVYGAREVKRSARLSEAPPADYTRAARDAKLKGDVRLRLVLAEDGTVKHVFPVKSLGHGLTESAVGAARRIRFEPAQRDGRPVSQFVTLVYHFGGKRVSSAPYVPKTVF